jgi:NAD(P)-dependent dehydrogenase (short-subunit alcohol dehydrogenase family)
MRLKDKVAVITGGGSGIGRAMVLLFAAEGAKVVAGEWKPDSLDEVVAAVKKEKGEITGVRGNVAVRAEAEALVDTAVKTYGKLDIVCNCAGVMDMNQGVGEVEDETWERLITINLNGPMFVSRRAIKVMLPQKSGSIINISSMAGIGGGPSGVAYAASKHALVGLTLNTAWIYAKQGIRCNAICPGGVLTKIMTSVDADKMREVGSKRALEFVAMMPAIMQPIEIARMGLFLASDESKYVNGAIIPVDAGWQAC